MQGDFKVRRDEREGENLEKLLDDGHEAEAKENDEAGNGDVLKGSERERKRGLTYEKN